MKLLILGGTGQLGRSLLAILSNSFEILAPSRDVVDVTHFESIRKYIVEHAPEVVINATAWTDVPGAEEFPEQANLINAEAVGNLAAICREINAMLIHISTDYVFDGCSADPYRESDLTAPLNEYGNSKLVGENLIGESGIENFYIVRTSWLYSRFGKNFVKTIALKAIHGEISSITSDQYGSPTSAGDLALGLKSLIDIRPESGIYHFSNSGVISWYDFGKAVYEFSNADTSLVSPRESAASDLKRPSYSPLDLTKWSDAGLYAVRDWKVALESELPSIIREIQGAE